MFWNRRFILITVGVALAVTAAVVLLPAITGFTSLDGTVNATVVTIAAPIQGTVVDAPPKPTTPVTPGEQLFIIENNLVNKSNLTEFAAELDATRERLASMTTQEQELQALSSDLEKRLELFQRQMVENLEKAVALQQERIGIADAKHVDSQSDLSRKQQLRTGGYVAESEFERVRMAQLVAHREADSSRIELERLGRQLEAAQRGVFVNDGHNDVPYSRQRIDEIKITLADLQAKRREQESRVQKLSQQLEGETERIKGLSSASIRSPLAGVVWRRLVTAGSHVEQGMDLVRVVDCNELFVDIIVAEVDYDETYAGRPAEVRLLGRDDVLQGKVVAVRGSAADSDEKGLAATPPQSKGKTARIRVQIAASDLNRDYANFCHIGRTAQVRFETRSFPLKRWVRSLWFSIS